MISLIPIIICVMCICSSMIVLGAIVISRANDKNRNLIVDYFLYIGLCLSCICVLILVVPSILIGYSLLDLSGVV